MTETAPITAREAHQALLALFDDAYENGDMQPNSPMFIEAKQALDWLRDLSATPITAREALELAANRFDRVVLDQEFGSERRYVVSEWADEARAAAAALSVQPARDSEKLPCDVQLPGVLIRKGAMLSTLLEAINARRDWPEDECRLERRPTDAAARDALIAAVQPVREGLLREAVLSVSEEVVDGRFEYCVVRTVPAERTIVKRCGVLRAGRDAALAALAEMNAALAAAGAPVETGWQARAREALKTSDLRPWGWAPGSYTVRCMDCGPADRDQINWKLGDKRSTRCRPCAEKARDEFAASLPPTPPTGEG